MERILLSFGHGYSARALARRLLPQGWRVLGTTRSPDKAEALAATGVPAGLTLVEVDYDTRTDLRQEYGVTVQHSFVKVDDSGSRVDVWTGTTTGEAIAERAA